MTSKMRPVTRFLASFDTRGLLLIVWVIAFQFLFFVLAGPSWELALYRLIEDGGTAAAWLVAAIGFGWILWRWIDPLREDDAPAALAVVTCAALGIGILSLAILGLGLIGWLNQFWAIAILAVGGIIAVVVALGRGKNFDLQAWLATPASWNWLWALLAPLTAIVVIGAFIPPGLLWGDEPNGYDVVEYHLQVPREWYEAGRIVALHHNVFSYFPFNVEMHYLLAMHLHGGPSAPWAGMYLAQLMHATMCALAVVAVYGLAGGGRRGVAAGLLMAAAPWVPLLASVAYNDGGTLLFGVLAIGWAIRARSMRAFILAGLMAGFAGGTKLSILPLLFVGVPIILILVRPIPWRSVSGGCAIYLLAGAAALSPWLIRNDAWTGNPVFPEAMRIFGKAHFSDVQVERWRQAYLPDKDHRSVGGHLSALETQILTDWRYGVALLPLGIATFLITFRKRAALYLMGLLLFQLLFWLFFTHLQSRFMVIAIPIIALMIAQSERREWFWVCTLTAVGMICYCGVTVTMKLERSLALDRRLVSANGVGILGRQNFEGFRLLDIKSLRPGASVDLVGDSCAFLYQIPMTRLHYKTVFDVDTSDRSKSIVQDWLAGMPRDALPWLDASGSADLARFAKTYYAIPPLPPAPIWK